MYKVVYTKTAAKDVPKLKSAHLDEKAKALIEIIRVDPFQNPPPYEKLVGDLNGAYSRRINIQHCLVYQVYEKSRPLRSSVCGRTMNDKSNSTSSENPSYDEDMCAEYDFSDARRNPYPHDIQK